MPYIPPETITNIIRLSLIPRNDFETAYEREISHLCEWSLVCKTWRELAQREIFRSLEVESSYTSKELLATLRERLALGTAVKCLRVWTGNFATPRVFALLRVGALLREVWGNLEELQLVSVDDFPLRGILNLKGLRKLDLYFVFSEGEAKDCVPRFPLLEELSIVNCDGWWVPSLLRQEVLPHLRSLRLDKLVGQGINPTTLSPLLSQLEVLSLECDDDTLPRASASLLNTLNILWDVKVFDDGRHRWEGTSVGRIVFKHLRLVLQEPDYTWQELREGVTAIAVGARTLAAMLVGNDDSVRSVQSIYLPPELQEGTNGASLHAICKERGVAIVYEEVVYDAFVAKTSEHFWRTTRGGRHEAERSWSR